MSEQNDNVTLQREELEALSSIYGDDFTLEDDHPPTFSVVIRQQSNTASLGEKEASLMVTFETDYPCKAPPIFQLSIPWIRGNDKMAIIAELEQIYLDNMGESIVYLWVERLRELVDKDVNTASFKPATSSPSLATLPLSPEFAPTSSSQPELREGANADSTEEKAAQLPEGTVMTDANLLQKFGAQCQSSSARKLTISTGEPFTDRKSTFQAHLAPIHDQAQVRIVLDELHKNKKFSAATHNMYAYRLWDEGRNSYLQDCDDDGETHAGSRLLHLLQILDCRNVIVVVSRWFGGIQLHSDRFKHINNVARQLLEQQGFIHIKTSKK